MILLTSWLQHGVSTAAREAGIVACLPKPVRTWRLLESLLGAVDDVGAEPPTAGHAAPAVGRDVSVARLGRILAAEDNTVNKMVITRTLEKLGYEVVTVENGVQAVEAVTHARYDAVLMDCQMPELDGFAATRAIRDAESGTGRRIPIIALTASAMEADRERCEAAGMDAFLTKPIKRQDLVELLERWLPHAVHA
jgi:CheY-like chemotaxis protein